MRRYLVELIFELEDIIAMVSLYRPGPMELIPQFIGGKHGQSATYLTQLKPILETTSAWRCTKTVMQMARDLADYVSRGRRVAKAVGKNPRLLKNSRENLWQVIVTNGIPKKLPIKFLNSIIIVI